MHAYTCKPVLMTVLILSTTLDTSTIGTDEMLLVVGNNNSNVNLQWLSVKVCIPCKDGCRTLLLLAYHHKLVSPPLAYPIHNQQTIWNNNNKSWWCVRFSCAHLVNMHWAVKDHSIAVPQVDPLHETCLFHPFQSTKKDKTTMIWLAVYWEWLRIE